MSSMKQDGELGEVYAAETSEELAAVYDRWSDGYDRYMNEGGYRHPAVCAALIARYISNLQAPLLDAGVGTGLVGELLSLLGYQKLIGIESSKKALDNKEKFFKKMQVKFNNNKLIFSENIIDEDKNKLGLSYVNFDVEIINSDTINFLESNFIITAVATKLATRNIVKKLSDLKAMNIIRPLNTI